MQLVELAIAPGAVPRAIASCAGKSRRLNPGAINQRFKRDSGKVGNLVSFFQTASYDGSAFKKAKEAGAVLLEMPEF